MTISCPLCRHQAALFYDFKQRFYYQCGFCSAIIKDPTTWPDRDTERSRYLEHLNQVDDARFQQFVSPITERVKQRYNVAEKGLDFGAGHAPVISHVLRQSGYDTAPYDPLFFNNPELLQQRYDYICSCEVIEHFHKPAESFALLRRLLNPGGSLFCMTELYHEAIDFHRWNYKNDPTHVFMYHRNTISYIADKFNFLGFSISGRLVEFSA
jgi:SAM-dependent methyltransferase